MTLYHYYCKLISKAGQPHRHEYGMIQTPTPISSGEEYEAAEKMTENAIRQSFGEGQEKLFFVLINLSRLN